MERSPKALLTFMQFADALLQSFTGTVAAAMTGNAFFPGAAPLVTAVTIAQKDFAAALDKAKMGNKADIEAKNALKKLLLEQMRKLVRQVNNEGITREAYLTTGLRISSPVNTPVVLPSTFLVELLNGINSGELIVNFKDIKGAQRIQALYCTDEVITPASAWQVATCSTKSCLISNLTVGKRVWIKPSILGRKNQIVTGPTLQSKPVQ